MPTEEERPSMFAPDEVPAWQRRPASGQVNQDESSKKDQTTKSHGRDSMLRVLTPVTSSYSAPSPRYGSHLRPEDARRRQIETRQPASRSNRNSEGTTSLLGRLGMQNHVHSPQVALYPLETLPFRPRVPAQRYSNRSGHAEPHHISLSVPRPQTAPSGASTVRTDIELSKRHFSNHYSTFPPPTNDGNSTRTISHVLPQAHNPRPHTTTRAVETPSYIGLSTNHDHLHSPSRVQLASVIHSGPRNEVISQQEGSFMPSPIPIKILELDHLVVITPSKTRIAEPKVWEISPAQIPHVLQRVRRMDFERQGEPVTHRSGVGPVVVDSDYRQIPTPARTVRGSAVAELDGEAGHESQRRKRHQEILYVRLPTDKSLQRDFKTAVEDALHKVADSAGLKDEIQVRLCASGNIEL